MARTRDETRRVNSMSNHEQVRKIQKEDEGRNYQSNAGNNRYQFRRSRGIKTGSTEGGSAKAGE